MFVGRSVYRLPFVYRLPYFRSPLDIYIPSSISQPLPTLLTYSLNLIAVEPNVSPYVYQAAHSVGRFCLLRLMTLID